MIPARIDTDGPIGASWPGGDLRISCQNRSDEPLIIGKLVAAYNMHDALLEQLRRSNAAMTAMREALEDLRDAKK